MFIQSRFALIFVVATILFAAIAHASEQTRSYLYQKFENGDIPSQDDSQILDLNGDGQADIVFTRHADNSVTVAGASSTTYADHLMNGNGNVIQLYAGQSIGPDDTFGASGTLIPDPLWTGSSANLGVQFDIAGTTHYGYIQLTVGTPGTADPFLIESTYAAWDDSPNTPITVPEPATLCFTTGAISLLLLCRPRSRAK